MFQTIMGVAGSPKRKLFLLCIFLSLCRCALLFIGFDRLPVLPVLGDEVIINDPAVSLAQSGQFVCSSLPNSPLRLDRLYGHYPPVFQLVQATLFRVFGLSALTLRIIGLLSSAAVPILGMLALYELLKRRIIDLTTVLFLAPVIFFDASTIACGRWARMEMLADVFTSLAIWLLLRNLQQRNRHWHPRILAGACMGLAFGTHLAVIGIYPFFLFLLLLTARKKVTESLTPILLSGTIPALLWLCVHGRSSLAAWRQMAEILRYAPGPFLEYLKYLETTSGSLMSFQQLNQVGGTVAVLLLVSPVVLVAKALFVIRAAGLGGLWRDEAGKMLSICTVCTVGVLVPIVVFMPYGPSRLMLLFPLVTLDLAVGLTPMGPLASRLRTAVLIALLLLQVGSLSIYFKRLPGEWQERASGRYNAIVSSIGTGDSAIVPPELWFAFRSLKRPVAVLYPWMGELSPWLDHPQYMDAYEVVIVKSGMDHETELTSIARRQHSLANEWRIGGESFHVFTRQAHER